MSATITVEAAQAGLKDLIHRLEPGEELVITENELPVAKLVGASSSMKKPRVAGLCKGMISLDIEDDEHLKDFAEYMP